MSRNLAKQMADEATPSTWAGFFRRTILTMEKRLRTLERMMTGKGTTNIYGGDIYENANMIMSVNITVVADLLTVSPEQSNVGFFYTDTGWTSATFDIMTQDISADTHDKEYSVFMATDIDSDACVIQVVEWTNITTPGPAAVTIIDGISVLATDTAWRYVGKYYLNADATAIIDIGSVTAVTATAPIVSSGGSTPDISMTNQGTTTTVLHGNAAGEPTFGAVVEADQTLADNTTRNVSTSMHGYAPKAVAPAATFMNVMGIANGETTLSNKPMFNDGAGPSPIGIAANSTETTASRYGHVHNFAPLAANSALGNTGAAPAVPAAVSMLTTATASSIALRDASANLSVNNILVGYTFIAMAGGTTVLTVASARSLMFTGTTTQTVQLPDVTTLTLGHTFSINNLGTGTLTINSSGGNLLTTLVGAYSTQAICVAITGTTEASWIYNIQTENTYGTYTPTLYNTTNVAASTAYACQYYRFGNNVTVSGVVAIDPTASGAATLLGMTIPVASNFASGVGMGGACNSPSFTETIGILPDATNDRASFSFLSATDVNHALYFIFSYLVI